MFEFNKFDVNVNLVCMYERSNVINFSS